MIVVDTNVLVHLLLGGEQTFQARIALRRDPQWAAPVLWRSEFLNVLAYHLRQARLELSDARELVREAESLLAAVSTCRIQASS